MFSKKKSLQFFDETDPVLAPFADHYKKFVLPKVAIFEEKRKKAKSVLRLIKIFGYFVIPIGYLVIRIIFLPTNVSENGIITISSSGNGGLVATVAYFSFIIFIRKAYRKNHSIEIQKELFPEILKIFGNNFSYLATCSPGIIDKVINSGIIPSYNRAICEDHIEGIHNEVELEIFESDLWMETGTGKNRRVENVFNGIFILLEMNKNFSNTTIALQDAGFFNKLRRAPEGLSRVKLEDPEFEDKFEVYSGDQVEARYLLTTSFMDRVLKLEQIFNAKVTFSFFDKKLLLMIPLESEYFEVSIDRPISCGEDIKIFLQRMNAIFEVIDTLKLDQQSKL